MYQSDLNGIAEHILQYNTYFNVGYADVYQDDKTGIIHNNEVIFPNDTLGDYFYLRLPKSVSFDYNARYNVNDCDKGVALKSNVILVACVRGADSTKLIDNLIITLRNYNPDHIEINIKSCIFNTVEVIMQELNKLKEEDLLTALKNVDEKYCIVSVSFDTTIQLLPRALGCIQDPCKDC